MEIQSISVSKDLFERLEKEALNLPTYTNTELKQVRIQEKIFYAFNSITEFSALQDKIKNAVSEYPYSCLIDGLSFDNRNYILIGISYIFGRVVEPYNKDEYELIQTIQPATDFPSKDNRTLVEYLHTDSTSFRNPNDITCLSCINPDRNNEGYSILMPLEMLLDSLVEYRGYDFIHNLKKTRFPWLLSNNCDDNILYAPIITEDSLRWMHHTIEAALSTQNHLLESSEIRTITDDLFQILANKNFLNKSTQFLLQKNQLLIFDNKKNLHGRSRITDPTNSGRIMKRARVIV